ncbi:MAG: MBL fold metallo-hydrolase [Synergistetes bacterium]|nr:MBL fold metallo-hydrolase [Synergistota bacterium]MDW8191827.1 MBL fold metallo-hydrolase [Synergistota bacterium]
MVFKQLRASGGIWLNYADKNILIDPGPGCLVRCLESRPKLDPTILDYIILSHRHLDHCADINTMVEAMTEGGFSPRGVLLAPFDALEGEDRVVLKYLRSYLKGLIVLKEGKFEFDGFALDAIPLIHHGVETFGLRFSSNREKEVSIIMDTKFFENLPLRFKADLMVLSVTLRKKREDIDHLSLDDAFKIIHEAKPQMAILTHFGRGMLFDKPWVLAEEISKQVRVDVKAASDGMKIEF